LIKFLAASGVKATLLSPSWISFGTPIVNWSYGTPVTDSGADFSLASLAQNLTVPARSLG